jgi:hypothetical protein
MIYNLDFFSRSQIIQRTAPGGKYGFLNEEPQALPQNQHFDIQVQQHDQNDQNKMKMERDLVVQEQIF